VPGIAYDTAAAESVSYDAESEGLDKRLTVTPPPETKNRPLICPRYELDGAEPSPAARSPQLRTSAIRDATYCSLPTQNRHFASRYRQL